MGYFVGLIGTCIIIVLFLVRLRHSKINKFYNLVELVENNKFDDLMLIHYISNKVVSLEYRIKKHKDDHPFLKKMLQEEFDWFKSVLEADNDKIIVFEKKNRLKTLIISEMINNPLLKI